MMYNHLSVLEPLDEDFEQLEQILALLAEESDALTRADLAEELVREASFVEDTQDQALYPLLEKAGFLGSTKRLRRSGEQVRVAMEPVYKALHHTVPMNAMLSEPDFEQEVIQLCRAVQNHVANEFLEVSEIESRMSARDCERIRSRLRSVRRFALGRPRPPHNHVRRFFTRIIDKIDRTFPDTSAQYRPGRRLLAEGHGVTNET